MNVHWPRLETVVRFHHPRASPKSFLDRTPTLAPSKWFEILRVSSFWLYFYKWRRLSGPGFENLCPRGRGERATKTSSRNLSIFWAECTEKVCHRIRVPILLSGVRCFPWGTSNALNLGFFWALESSFCSTNARFRHQLKISQILLLLTNRFVYQFNMQENTNFRSRHLRRKKRHKLFVANSKRFSQDTAKNCGIAIYVSILLSGVWCFPQGTSNAHSLGFPLLLLCLALLYQRSQMTYVPNISDPVGTNQNLVCNIQDAW